MNGRTCRPSRRSAAAARVLQETPAICRVHGARTSPHPTHERVECFTPREASARAPPVYSDHVRQISAGGSGRAAGRPVARRDADGRCSTASIIRRGNWRRPPGVSPQAASAHLGKLTDGGFLKVHPRRTRSPVRAGAAGGRPCAGVARGDGPDGRVSRCGGDGRYAAAVRANVLRPPGGTGGGRAWRAAGGHQGMVRPRGAEYQVMTARSALVRRAARST